MQTQRNGTSRRGKPWRLLRMARVAQIKRPRRGRRAEAVCVGTPAGVGLGRSASRSLALRYEVGRLWPRPLLVLMRPWKVRKDEKAIAARPGIDDSLCIRRGGDGDRRLLLAVLDGRVTAYSKQATGKFKFGHEGLKQRLGAHRRLARCVAMWCDAASREGMLRCAEARRVAYRDVDKSYASHRPC
jgi:hypothetical protein